MKIRHDFPRPVAVIEHLSIPLADGTRLAATVWLPEDAAERPVPAIVEYLPYRRGDWTAARDAARHPYIAGHGYASIRIDMRGSGDSEGVLLGEYLPQEQNDALEALAFIAAQPWCTGELGMIGISWGGFNSLQIAARRPPGLRAIITVCSTDDRYADDVHYIGGAVLGIDMAAWAATMFAFNARPPDPAVVGERWRELWRARLESNRPWIEEWLAHQRRDAYWQQGSVCEDYRAIEAAVYAVGGFADPYRSTVLRLLANLSAPCKGLIGPWSHRYPDQEYPPGPAIGFLQESLRWWDYWLKGEDTEIMDEPRLRVWMQDSYTPGPSDTVRRGRWVCEDGWPSARLGEQTLTLDGEHRLRAGASEQASLRIRSPQSNGVDAGRYFPIGNPGDLAPDQRRDDGASLCFDSDPLGERLEILGFPQVVLRLQADAPVATATVRLCDVAEDGTSALVTRGFLNLTHRASHEQPEPLVPGRWYTVTIQLGAIAHAFAPGRRIRLAISSAYWPWIWPSPSPTQLTVEAGSSRLVLPVRDRRPADGDLRPFPPPENAPPLPATGGESPPVEGGRVLSRDLATGHITLVVEPRYMTETVYRNGRCYGETARDVYAITEGDPLAASAQSRWTISIGREGWQTRIETDSTLACDAEAFITTNTLRAFEGASLVFERTWAARIGREHV